MFFIKAALQELLIGVFLIEILLYANHIIHTKFLGRWLLQTNQSQCNDDAIFVLPAYS